MSSKDFVTTGKRVGASLKLRHQAAYASWVATVPEGTEVLITFSRAKATRSEQQNRFYWGVIVDAISSHTGYTPEETHECLKQLFLPKKLAMLDGNGDVHNELVIGGSTTKLSKVEFGEYCTQVREWAFDHLGIYIPLPSESEAA